MTNLGDLIKAVVRNHKEDAPLWMLADHLLEANDSRGEIIRRAINSGPYAGRQGVGHKGEGPYHREDLDGDHNVGLTSFPQIGVDGDLRFTVTAFDRTAKSPQPLSRSMTVAVPHTEARQIADTLPNAEEVHKFLDTHFGPDDRYTDSLNKALKPE